MGKKAGTSIPEQAIYFYVHRFFPDAKNRHRFKANDGRTFEVDIYIPNAEIAIEYDGSYWHQKKYLLEEEKNRFLSNNQIFLIRVRESGLPDISLEHGIVLLHKDKKSTGLHMNEIITEIIHIAAKHTDQQASIPEESSLSFEEYCDDYPDILNGFYTGVEKPNATSNCTYPFWDTEKNSSLDPNVIKIMA